MKCRDTIPGRLSRFSQIMAVSVAGLLSPSLVLADGTKQVFSDAGLYPGTDLLLWAASAVQADAHGQMTNAPEGREVLSMAVDQPWGGGGVFFMAGGQVIDLDCSDYAGGAARFRLNSTNDLSLQIEYVSTTGSNAKGSWTVANTGGQWKEIVVPFSSFSPVPNLARIRGLFGPCAEQVEAVVLSQSAPGVDGLLGLSFLSRFDFAIQKGEPQTLIFKAARDLANSR